MSQRLPRVLTVLAGLGLLGSAACFPLPTIVLPGSGPRPTPLIDVVPTPHPSVSPSASASPGATPSAGPSVSSSVYPLEGRVYTVADHKANATRVYTITSVDGSLVTYDLATSTGGSSPTVSRSQHVTQVNGVFWTEAGASPVTQGIESYPQESVTVQAGTFPAFKVTSGANTFWFCGGICIKASGADVDFELTKVL